METTTTYEIHFSSCFFDLLYRPISSMHNPEPSNLNPLAHQALLHNFYKKSCQCCHKNGGGILQHFLYLYNKNVIEYAQIARSGPKSMIRNIEGY